MPGKLASRRSWGAALGLGLVACGAAPAPVATAPAVQEAALPAPDLTEVPAPAGILVYARATHPLTTMKTLRASLDAARTPSPDLPEWGRLLSGEDIGSVVDNDGSVDFALVNGGRGMIPAWAVASAVRSVDAVRTALPARLELVADTSKTAYWIRSKGSADSTTEHPCEVAPAAGSTPFRLVCGASEEAVEYLAPYLTRTAPRHTWDADFHAEVYPAPIKPFARILRQQAPALLESMLQLDTRADATTTELVKAMIADLVDLIEDLDTTKLDVKVDAEGAHANLDVGFTGNTSVVARLLTSFPERSAVAPPSFWRLPKDSDSAAFTRGHDPKDLERARELLVRVAAGVLAKAGFAPADPPPDPKALAAAIDALWSPSPVVVARGSDPKLALGWWVVGFDEPPARLEGAMKGFAASLGHPSGKAPHAGPAPYFRSAPVPRSLPRGSLHFEIGGLLPPNSGGRREVGHASWTTLHAFLVPDASEGSVHTWLVLASDEKRALAKIEGLAVGSKTPSGSTLATATGLERLAEQHQNRGGFGSLRAWLALTTQPLPALSGAAFDPLGALASLPHQGQSPILFSDEARAKGSEGPRAGGYSVRVFVPRAALEDILTLGSDRIRGQGPPGGAMPSPL